MPRKPFSPYPRERGLEANSAGTVEWGNCFPLFISEHTVKNHVSNIYRKLGTMIEPGWRFWPRGFCGKE